MLTTVSRSSDQADGKGDLSPAEAKAIVQKHFEAINNRDRSAVADLHADDVVVHSAGRELTGLDAVIEDWWAQLDAIPDLEDDIDMLIVEGDRVAVRYRTTGTHEGEFLGIEPTGKSVEITSMAIVRIEGGEIAEWWNHPDRYDLFQQLGLVEEFPR